MDSKLDRLVTVLKIRQGAARRVGLAIGFDGSAELLKHDSGSALMRRIVNAPPIGPSPNRHAVKNAWVDKLPDERERLFDRATAPKGLAEEEVGIITELLRMQFVHALVICDKHHWLERLIGNSLAPDMRLHYFAAGVSIPAVLQSFRDLHPGPVFINLNDQMLQFVRPRSVSSEGRSSDSIGAVQDFLEMFDTVLCWGWAGAPDGRIARIWDKDDGEMYLLGTMAIDCGVDRPHDHLVSFEGDNSVFASSTPLKDLGKALKLDLTTTMSASTRAGGSRSTHHLLWNEETIVAVHDAITQGPFSIVGVEGKDVRRRFTNAVVEKMRGYEPCMMYDLEPQQIRDRVNAYATSSIPRFLVAEYECDEGEIPAEMYDALREIQGMCSAKGVRLALFVPVRWLRRFSTELDRIYAPIFPASNCVRMRNVEDWFVDHEVPRDEAESLSQEVIANAPLESGLLPKYVDWLHAAMDVWWDLAVANNHQGAEPIWKRVLEILPSDFMAEEDHEIKVRRVDEEIDWNVRKRSFEPEEDDENVKRGASAPGGDGSGPKQGPEER